MHHSIWERCSRPVAPGSREPQDLVRPRRGQSAGAPPRASAAWCARTCRRASSGPAPERRGGRNGERRVLHTAAQVALGAREVEDVPKVVGVEGARPLRGPGQRPATRGQHLPLGRLRGVIASSAQVVTARSGLPSLTMTPTWVCDERGLRSGRAERTYQRACGR
jgi:hypothetical protein